MEISTALDLETSIQTVVCFLRWHHAKTCQKAQMPRLGDKGKLQSSIDATLQRPNGQLAKQSQKNTSILKKPNRKENNIKPCVCTHVTLLSTPKQ
jgi:hypothetical protein